MQASNLPESAEQATADEGCTTDAEARRPWRPLNELAPIAVGTLLVVALSLAWLQVLHPYLEHDDWDSILPVTTTRRHYIYGRLLNEGRWLNYWWWLRLGHLFSTVGASFLYQAAYLAFVVRVAWRWALGWLRLPVVVGLFAAPMVVEASFWPSTLGPSMVVAAAAAWTLPLCAAHNRRLACWIVAVVVLSFFAYPPVTLVLFLVMAVELIDDSWKRLIGASVLFGLSYIVALLGIFALNKRAFGKFGIEVQQWRRPNPLHNLHDLWINLKRYLLQVDRLAHITALPIVVGLCALVVCLVVPDLRRRAVRLTLAFMVVMGLEAGPTILNGVLTAYRGSWWAWFLPVVPLIWLAQQHEYLSFQARSVTWPRVIRTASVLALVAVGVWGIQYWRTAVHYNQHRLALYNAVEQQMYRAVKQHPSDRVFIYGDTSDWKHYVFTEEAQYLRMRAAYAYGLTLSDCVPPRCNLSQQPAVATQIQQGQQVMHGAGFILVVPPSHVRPHPSFR